jgi:uncharacterized membrane protein YgcG
MANTFDIGPSGDLAIFTNNSEDMFNIGGDLGGPNLILDQGNNRGIVDIGKFDNLVSDITLDVKNEAPIDFGLPLPLPLPLPATNNNRVPRQRIESNTTIEAEPIKKPSKSREREKTPPVFVNPKTPKNLSTEQFPSEQSVDPPIDINFGFDDILDSRKLKPVNDQNEIGSVGGDSVGGGSAGGSIGGGSQATIKAPPIYEFNEPQSPEYRSDTPPPSLPTTFQNDRRGKVDRQDRQVPVAAPISAPIYEELPKYVNEEDEKMDLLLKLQALESRKGIRLSKHYNLKSSLDEIRMEYRNQSAALETEASIKFMRKGLIFCTSGMEYMNRRFDPVGAKLDGWGENVMENIMDFDGIFERLHHKYSGSVQMEPEMELLFALGGSAFMFHLSHTLFKTSMPQFGNVLRENPDVLSGILGVAKEAAKRSQAIPMAANDTGGGGGGGSGGSSGSSGGMSGVDLGSIMNQLGLNPEIMSNFARSMGQPPPEPQATRDFREPPVNDLYRQMVEKSQQNDDALSVTSDASEGRIIGKAVISPLPASKRGGGGNIIKL